MKISYEQLLKILPRYKMAVDYRPMKDEPDPKVFLAPLKIPVCFTIPATRLTNATEILDKIKLLSEDSLVFLCVPGMKFDKWGVRHGRGGGWYDRFLSAASPKWLRIGFCFESQFSLSPLKREVWDEPVDFVCVKKDDKTDYYETKARII